MTITLNRKFEIHQVTEDGTPEHTCENSEYRRQQVLQAAMDAIYSVLDQGSDGSVEESDFLLSSVALRLLQSVNSRHISALLSARFLAMHAK